MAYYNSRYGHRSYHRRHISQQNKSSFVDTKYKINAPSLDEFGLTKTDITNVKLEYEEWKKVSTYNGHLIGSKEANDAKSEKLFITIVKIVAPLCSIFGIVCGIIEMESFGTVIGYAVMFPILGTVGVSMWTFLIAKIIIKIASKAKNDNKVPKKFLLQDKLDKITAFENAIKDHEYWQNLKKEDYWRAMNGRNFEHEINDLFIRHGYKTKLCKGGGDGGVDIIAVKDKNRIAIQCKAHASKISPSVARDLLGTISANGFNKGYLITLNGGTNGTIAFCKNNGLVLWDIKDILRFQHEE